MLCSLIISSQVGTGTPGTLEIIRCSARSNLGSTCCSSSPPIDAGEIRSMRLAATVATLYGAARPAADFVAPGEDPARAATDCREVLATLLRGLRV